MRITEALDLKLDQREINFIDLHFKNDTTLFLDPFSFKKKKTVFCKNSSEIIDSFFLEIKLAIKNKNSIRLNYLFSHSEEAIYLPLGYSMPDKVGKGVGNSRREQLVNYLTDTYFSSFRDAFTILNDFGNIPGIKNDIISDIIGNLIYETLSLYTVDQCILHKKTQFLIETPIYTWCTMTKSWIKKNLKILSIEGKEFFLIPRDIIRTNVINVKYPLKTYFVKNNLIDITDKPLEKKEILTLMSNYSTNYSDFIDQHISEDYRIKTLSREKIIKKLNLININEKNYLDSLVISDNSIASYKNIIELLFFEYTTYPRLNTDSLLFNNLNEKKLFPNSEYVSFTLNNSPDNISSYKPLLIDNNIIEIVIVNEIKPSTLTQLKELCTDHKKSILIFTLNEIKELLISLKKSKVINFKKVDKLINSKLKKLY